MNTLKKPFETNKPTYIVSIEMTGDLDHIWNAYEEICVSVPVDALDYASIVVYPADNIGG